MKITVLGAGGAFADLSRGNSAFLIEHLDRKILVDCGTTVPLILGEMKIPLTSITDVVITHCHADHIGGLEQLGYAHKFFPGGDTRDKPALWTSWEVAQDLEQALAAMSYDQSGAVHNPLDEYFTSYHDGSRDHLDKIEQWGGLELGLYEALHVGAMPAVSVWIGDLYISGDTCQPTFHWPIGDDRREPKLIFHEAEFGGINSGVHVPIDELRAAYYPEGWKEKTWLYHCAPQPAEAYEGFAGVLQKGQTFEL